MKPSLHRAWSADLDTRTLYALLRLRVQVFVVEQACAYREVDGRDLDERTLHLWIEEGGEVAAYLRLYPGSERADWIGRVATAAGHRHRGLGATLMTEALGRTTRPVRISAQVRLADWYGSFGFVRCGPDFDEDGMPHIPMRLD